MVASSWLSRLLSSSHSLQSFSVQISTQSLSSLSLWTLFLFSPLALADCECGYLSTVGDGVGNSQVDTSDPSIWRQTPSDSSNLALFTDLLETDFTRVYSSGNRYDVSKDTDWVPQAFNLTKERARGEWGEMFDVRNVFSYPPNKNRQSRPGEDEMKWGPKHWNSDDKATGLKLVVRSDVVDGMVPVAEVATRRLDLLYGSFRASMKISDIPGTCAAFFWYFNDTQEIDMEFLTREFNRENKTFPINLVLQSRESALAGHDASGTGESNFIHTNLPFDPTLDFHEYRIDYLPTRVIFYADGKPLATMAASRGAAVPTSQGHLILSHWSNGNPLWSGGPPKEDSALTVKYVKAYFNSSSETRQDDWRARCQDPKAKGAVCRIPDVVPGDKTAVDWYFKFQGNMTNNQTMSSEPEEDAAVRLGTAGRLAWIASVLAGFVIWVNVL